MAWEAGYSHQDAMIPQADELLVILVVNNWVNNPVRCKTVGLKQYV